MALNGPAWQSSMCEAIDRTELAQALTLIVIAYTSRARLVPALAGAYRRQAGRGSYSSSMQPPTRGSSGRLALAAGFDPLAPAAGTPAQRDTGRTELRSPRQRGAGPADSYGNLLLPASSLWL